MSIDGVHNKATITNTETLYKSEIKKENSFLQAFKDYFRGIKEKNQQYHNITISDIQNTAKETHQLLINSGATVVSYDENTGMTKYSNGVELYFNTNDNKASLYVELNEDDYSVSAQMETIEDKETDYNEMWVVEDNGKNLGEKGFMSNSFSYISDISQNQNYEELTEVENNYHKGFVRSKDKLQE